MNIKKPKEKTNRNVDQLKVLKKLEVKKNDTDTNILISNLNVKISNEKQKTTKTHSPHIKHPYIGSQINPFQNKESLISPKQATSNFINFTKRSNNIKFVHNNQSEVSMKCNLITNNTSHKNLELNSINKVANSINKSNKVKSSLITNIKDSKKPFDKQSTIFKISSKEGKFLIDTNKTIDLTGFTKNSSVINTPQNKMNIGKEFVSDQKSITVKNYEYKSSKANSSKNETLTTDTDIQTKVSSSNMSSINSKKTLFDNQTKSRFITKSISKKMKLDLSTDKINGKFIRSSKIITNQLETSNSKIKIKNIKIPIHKKEINLFSLSKGNKKSNDCSNFIKSSKNNESFLSSTIHINVNANKNKFLNNSNVAPQNFNKIDKKQIIQLDRTKIINNSRNINTERSINQGFSPKQSKKDSNNDILKTDQFYEKLSSYEIEELKNIKNVYFYGKSYENDSCILSIKIAINIDEKAMKSNGGSFTPKKINKSFEDEHGNYIVHKGDHINYRYEVISELGKGSYGQAIKCFDHKLKTYCCVKIIRKDEKFTNQAKIEIRILKYILANDKNNSSNIVKIRENFIFRKHVCIVFELLENNLYELLKSNNFSGLELNLIKSIAKQILISMYFLQNNNIIHCDLKPENIVINDSNNGSIKVIDFGSSCFDNEKLYEYIQSRYYRAPEVILGLGYNTQIDMWSFGCVLAELYNGFPIFSGENEFDQLNFIMEYLGEPPDYIKLSSKKKEMFFMDNLHSIKKENSRGKVRMPNTKKLEDFLESAEVEFIDLIKKCLVWNPFKRIKPDEALKHRFFSNDKKSFFNKNKQTHKLLNIIDNKKSNFLKYKVQINKLANLRCDHKIKSIVKNSNYSKEDQTNNHTK